MGLFDRFRKRHAPLLLVRAQSLVSMAYIGAVSDFMPMLDRFASLEGIDPKRWDKVLATAAIFVAVSRLNQINVAHTERNALLDVVTNEALRRDSCSVEALEDCRDFVDRSYDAMARNSP